MSHLEKLRQRVLKATIAELSPKNRKEIWDILSSRTKIMPDGQLVVLDGSGIMVSDTDFDTWSASLPKVRPDCFETSQPKTVEAGTNPFMRGPAYNITEQMRLMRTSPDIARRMEAEAQRKH